MVLAHFRIFVSSPGDVPDERTIAADVIESLSYDTSLRNKITAEMVAWDRPGAPPMEANIPPQEAISAGLPLPSQCDIVVVIFWTRMGTPLTIDGRSYQSGTEFEYREAMENRGANGLPSLLVYRRTQRLSVDLDDPDYDDKKEQYTKVRKFFEDEFTDAETGGLRGGYNSYESPDDFRAFLTDNLKYVIQRTLENNIKQNATPEKTIQKPELWQGSPFPGLRAFSDKDEAIFFGRGVETDKLVQRVRNDNFVAVVGASGSGKSSLVAAGVLPRIRKTSGTGQWTILSTSPDALGTNDPFAALSDTIAQAYPDDNTLNNLIQEAYQAKSLTAMIDYILGNDSDTRLLLFIDQFEELFTTIERELALKYIQMMLNSLEDERLHIVITVRGDFYNNCIEIKELAEILQGSTFPLAAPKRDALRMMIERPAERAGLEFEDNTLIATILNDTGDSAGALALLAYLLDELYHRRTDDNTLTKATYAELEGVQGAIGRRSEQTYEKLTEEQQATMTSVFRELVNVKQDGTVTRRRAARRTIAQNSEGVAFIKAMVDARLLVVNRGRDNQPYVEVAHEALLRSWERLAKWINETQGDLRKLQEMRQAAAEWDRTGRQDYRLWKHELLQPVYDMQKRLAVEFTEVEQAFTTPEAERLLEEFKGYQEGGLRDAMWRQMNIVARLTEIGVSAISIMFMCLGYSAGSGVKSSLIKVLKSHKLVDLMQQVKLSSEKLDQSLYRDSTRDLIWDGYLKNLSIRKKPPTFEELFVKHSLHIEELLQQIFNSKLPEPIPAFKSNLPKLESISEDEFDPNLLFGSDFDETSADELFSLDALDALELDDKKEGTIDWDDAMNLGILND